MITLAAIIAQGGAEVAAGNPLYVYGPLGIMCGWFMIMATKLFVLLKEFMVSLKADGDATRKETRNLGHHFRALEVAILFEASSRPGCPPVIKAYADRKIARSNEDMDTKE